MGGVSGRHLFQASAGGPVQTITSILTPYGAEWWNGDLGIHLTSGNVDTWTGSLLGAVIADSGTAGNRPAYAQPLLTFTGTNHLQNASGAPVSLSGKSTATLLIVGYDGVGSANLDFAGIRGGFFAWRGGGAPNVTANQWWCFTGGDYPAAETFGETGTKDSSTTVFRAYRVNWGAALGSICIPPMQNNATIAGVVTQQSGDTTPTTCPNNVFAVGACSAMGFGVTGLVASDVVLCPGNISLGDLTTLYNQFKLLRSF